MPFHREIQTLLAPTGEARALMLLLLEHEAGLTTAQVLTGEADRLPEELKAELTAKAQRVAAGEPIQYVMGEALFCELPIGVEPGVLIPRPETEELVKWASSSFEEKGSSMGRNLRILDLCTGSGCIALALKKQFPDAEVHAVEISEKALLIARRNALRLGLEVQFHQADVLAMDNCSFHSIKKGERFSMIISNPPYVCQEEAAEMETNVLAHEPHLALFVPDNAPLKFYRSIAQKGRQLLEDGGLLFLELNPRFATDTAALLQSEGYADVELRHDSFGQLRMLSATWNHSKKQ